MTTTITQIEKKHKKRDSEEVLYNILSICKHKKGVLKTQIMYGCNLSFRQLNDYLEAALKKKLLIYDDEKETYTLTENGKALLGTYELIHQLSVTGKNEIRDENKDPYVDPELIPEFEHTTSLLKTINESIKSIIDESIEKGISKPREAGRKRRDKSYIVELILVEATDGVLKTQIMYNCNLSYAQLQNYLYLLGLTNMIAPGDKGYKTTAKGKLFVESHRLGKNILDTIVYEELFSDIRLPELIIAALPPMTSFEIEEDKYAVSKKGLVLVKPR